MASVEYEQILVVQAHDMELRQMRHRRASHPERLIVDEAVAVTQTIDAQVAEVEQRKHGVQRDINRLADKVAQIEAKRAEVDHKLYGGSVTANKELMALQHEAANLLDRQNSVEDEELELMEQMEAIDDELAGLGSQRQQALGTQTAAEKVLGEALAVIDADIAQAESERGVVASASNPELIELYEQMAPQFDGAPIAKLTNGRCDGCHIQLSAIAVDQINKAPEDSVVSCEECGRVLVR